jgi:hypothetical protein
MNEPTLWSLRLGLLLLVGVPLIGRLAGRGGEAALGEHQLADHATPKVAGQITPHLVVRRCACGCAPFVVKVLHRDHREARRALRHGWQLHLAHRRA